MSDIQSLPPGRSHWRDCSSSPCPPAHQLSTSSLPTVWVISRCFTAAQAGGPLRESPLKVK